MTDEEQEEVLDEEVQDSENTDEEVLEEEDDEDTEEEVEEDEDIVAKLEAELKREKQKSQGMYKRLKSEQSKKVKPAKAMPSGIDPFEIAEVTSALQGLDELERDRLIKEAKMNGISLSEAKSSEDYKLWQKGYKGKVVKDKTPAPSTKQGTQGRGGSFSEQLAKASPKEREKLLIEKGLVHKRYGG